MSFVGIDIAFLGASSVSSKTGTVLWEPSVPITDADTDLESFGPSAVYQALGFASLPYQRTEDGYAECLIVRNAGGRTVCCLGGRDTRTASVVGNMKPGDTVVHSTGPNQAAQLQLKEQKRQSVLLTKTKGGKTSALILDGNLEKAQLLHAGAVLEMDDGGDVSLLNSAGCGLLIQGQHVHVKGTLVAGFGAPGYGYLLGPLSGFPAGPVVGPLPVAQSFAPALPGL